MSAFWLAWMPKAWRSRLEARDQVLRVADNAFWLLMDRALRMVLGLLVGIWVARYLGPDQFGLFNYVASVVALCASLSQLGLDDIVVRDLLQVKAPGRTLGSAFALKLGGGLLAWALAIVVAWRSRGDAKVLMLTAVYGSLGVLNALDVAAFWFQSQVRSRFVVMARGGAYVLSSGAKVAFILAGTGVTAFVILSVAEAAVAGLMLWLLFRRQSEAPWPWSVDFARMKELLRQSWPLFLAFLSYLLYTRTDQFMLGSMLGDHSVGIYSASSRVFEIPMALLGAVTASLYPKLVEWHRDDREKFRRRYQLLGTVLTWGGLASVALLGLATPWLLPKLYGRAYLESVPVLLVQVLGLIFIFNGALRSGWVALQEAQRDFLWCTLAAGIINVLGNLYLIPRYGAVGAAWATTGAQALSLLFSNLLFKSLRPLWTAQIRSILRPQDLWAGWRAWRS